MSLVPRLATSKKWTAFPEEYISQIKEVFSQGFEDQLDNKDLIVEGRIYAEEILLRIGILEQGRLAQANFEVSSGYNASQQDTVEQIYSCIDAAGTMMNEYFDALEEDEEDELPEFPRTWKEISFENKTLHVQFTTVNSNLEAKADALLKAADEKAALSLVVEEESTDDALDQDLTLLKNDEEIHDDSEDFESDDANEPNTNFEKPKRKEDLH